jgi:hypothetical protein
VTRLLKASINREAVTDVTFLSMGSGSSSVPRDTLAYSNFTSEWLHKPSVWSWRVAWILHELHLGSRFIVFYCCFYSVFQNILNYTYICNCNTDYLFHLFYCHITFWRPLVCARGVARHDGQKAPMSVSDSRGNDSVAIDLLVNINR